VVNNLNRFKGKTGIISLAVGEKIESLYYNAPSKNFVKDQAQNASLFLMQVTSLTC